MYPAIRLPYARRRDLRTNVQRLFAVLLGMTWCLLGAAAQAQVQVLTQHNDNARTGANLNETILTPATVTSAIFGKLFTRPLDANVNGQVLYVPGVAIQGRTHNVIYAYTSNNTNGSPSSVYAFDADDPNASTPLWRHQLTASAQWTTCTPVIDPTTSTMYVLTKSTNDNGPTNLRALDITTGNEKPGSPILIAASVPGTGDGSVNGVVSFDTSHANCRPGLLLLNGIVYVAFAHNSDSFPYHGWIFGYSYDQTRFTQRAVFCTNPNGGEDGIWMAGKGLSVDTNNNIYCTTGNGTFDIPSGGTSYGMCILKLNASLNVVDWFTPYDQAVNSQADYDLGNVGVLGIPGTTRMFVGGTKSGSAFLLDSTNLGHFTPNGPDKVVQRFDKLMSNDDVGQSAVCWDMGATKQVFLWPRTASLLQFQYSTTAAAFSPAGIYKQNANMTGGGSLAITANGSSGGILWAIGSDAVLHALDATDVTKPELWNSTLHAARDGLPSVGHFQFPTIANGKVYIATGSGTIAVYGILQNPATTYQINSGGPLVGAFSADTNFTNGMPYSVSQAIDTSGVANAAPMAVYQSLRFGDFRYNLPGLSPGGNYTVRLHFAEVYHTQTGQRVFNVAINGATVLSNFDIVAAAGPNKALVKDFTATADNTGGISIAFSSVVDMAQVNGIEIFSGSPPSAPTGLTAVAGNAQVALAWTAVTGATGYKVYRSQASGSGYAVIGSPTSASYLDTSLTNGTTYYYVVTAVNSNGESGYSNQASATPAAPAALYQINSGGGTVAPFSADTFYSGGSVYSVSRTIDTSGVANAAPMAVYQSLRYENFAYNVSGLTPGASYTVRLHFAEIYYTAVGQRVFNVAINGTMVLSNFDIVAAAGSANRAVVENLTGVADSHGKINVTFTSVVDNAQVNGVEILSGGGSSVPNVPTGLIATAGNAQVSLAWSAVSGAANYKVYRSLTSGSGYAVIGSPTSVSYLDTGLTNGTTYYYVVTAVNSFGESAYSAQASATPSASGALYQIDSGGGATGAFSADNFFTGGDTYSVSQIINTSAANAAPMAVYQSLRYGSFSYNLRNLTPGGSYTVRLHFAEVFFSKAGQRVFNVLANGATVLSNFDIVAAAGSANKAVVKDFTVTADSSGRINLTFSSVVENAQINGIEVLQ